MKWQENLSREQLTHIRKWCGRKGKTPTLADFKRTRPYTNRAPEREGETMSENTYKIDKGEFLKYQVLTKAHEIPIAECSMEYEANRVMASLNACNGISTEALEAGVVAELLEALLELRQRPNCWCPSRQKPKKGEHEVYCILASATIAKVKGEKPND